MKILIAEDDTTSRLTLAATLRKFGHDVTAVATGKAALQAWERDVFPMLISDWMMPELNGLDLCRAVRNGNRQHYTYVILLTALSGKSNQIDGMDSGADDFISKPFDEDLLLTRLRVAERILELHEALRTEATRDRLTGLLNRGAILDFLQQTLERRVREGGDVGVIMIDLDHFKQINDQHGHLTGDVVLREAARLMQGALRPYDRIGRYGGEEFIVVSPQADGSNSAVIAERVRSQLCASTLSTPGGDLWVTASLGVAHAAQFTSPTSEQLVASADEALYEAKRGGRNQVRLNLERDL
ncbi:MAG: GGDEF domain-containing protein [Pseudomarimonas sp.]